MIAPIKGFANFSFDLTYFIYTTAALSPKFYNRVEDE